MFKLPKIHGVMYKDEKKRKINVINLHFVSYTFGAQTEERFEEFLDRLERAGLPLVMEEFRRQYAEFLAASGL